MILNWEEVSAKATFSIPAWASNAGSKSSLLQNSFRYRHKSFCSHGACIWPGEHALPMELHTQLNDYWKMLRMVKLTKASLHPFWVKHISTQTDIPCSFLPSFATQPLPMLGMRPQAPYILQKSSLPDRQPPGTFILHFIVRQGPMQLPSLISSELSCSQAGLELDSLLP